VKFSGRRKIFFAAGVVFVAVGVSVAYQNCGQLGDSGLSAAFFSSGGSTNPTPGQSQYQQTVLNDSPAYYWPMDANTSVLQDLVGNDPATITGTFQFGVTGALYEDPGTAMVTTNSSYSISTAISVTSPTNFSYEAWFNTTTAGGMLLGFGDQQTDASDVYDLQLFMDNTGALNFGLFTTAPTQITSPNTYNDGKWHYVVASYTSGSIPQLYVDGNLVVSGTAITAPPFTGYIHIANDACAGWSNSPTQCAYIGELEQVAIYPTQLSAAQVLKHYQACTGP
jgi:hypothetical protein